MTNLRTTRGPIVFPLNGPHLSTVHLWQGRMSVEALAHRLEEEAHLTPWLDKWHLVPGEPWQEALEQALNAPRTCAVFIGPSGLGPWENGEMRSALLAFAGLADRNIRERYLALVATWR